MKTETFFNKQKRKMKQKNLQHFKNIFQKKRSQEKKKCSFIQN